MLGRTGLGRAELESMHCVQTSSTASSLGVEQCFVQFTHTYFDSLYNNNDSLGMISILHRVALSSAHEEVYLGIIAAAPEFGAHIIIPNYVSSGFNIAS